MPFKSEKQRRYLWKFEPDIAKRWAEEYSTPKNLPEKKKDPGVEALSKRSKKKK